MSALGQKQTFAVQKGMSALTPKADMCGALADVRFGSKADICRAPTHVRFTPNSDRESGPPQTVMSALPPKADIRHCSGSCGPECIATPPRDKLGSLVTSRDAEPKR